MIAKFFSSGNDPRVVVENFFEVGTWKDLSIYNKSCIFAI